MKTNNRTKQFLCLNSNKADSTYSETFSLLNDAITNLKQIEINGWKLKFSYSNNINDEQFGLLSQGRQRIKLIKSSEYLIATGSPGALKRLYDDFQLNEENAVIQKNMWPNK